jgi:hypothetical protein
MLTKEKLLAKCDRKPVKFEDPDYGEGYCLPLTCAEVDRLEWLMGTGRSFSAFILSRCLCDAQGKRMFAEEDEQKLAEGVADLRAVATSILGALQTEKDLLEKLEKNSPETGSDSAGSS